MKNYKKIVITAFALVLCFSANAQDNDKILTKKERIAVVNAISEQLESNYVFPKKADKMSAHIKKQQKKGHYKKIDDPLIFSNKLTEDLQAISHDKHIRVVFDPIGIARQNLAVTPEDRQKLRERQVNQMKRNNFGFKEVKILGGNIGYLDLRSFSDTAYASETAIAAMNYLSNSDAIIIDLRNNGGGSPAMIQLISSYLFGSETVHLNSFYWRPTDLNTQTWTLPHVPGQRSPDTPVYVLTSNSTFSAAEEFSYNLKNLERATLIGETTGGGAHPSGSINATDRFRVWVPSGRAINPITETNWEGTGVTPHIEVKQEDALNTAYIKALETLVNSDSDDESKQFYTWTLDVLKSKSLDIKVEASVLKSYAASYGPRVVTFEDNHLYYQRGAGTKYQLTAMSQTEFLIQDLPSFRIAFEIEKDKAVALIGKYDNGRTDKNLRD